MKHLIIGVKGNIGRYYASILKQLGQDVDGVDLGFTPHAYKRLHDSAVICTPPETHADIIGQLPAGMPVFCEKPLIINPTDSFSWRVENDRTLVSANWIFCEHLAPMANEKEFFINISYPAKDKYWPWDLIHFWSWFCYKVGKPRMSTIEYVGDSVYLYMKSHITMNVLLANRKIQKAGIRKVVGGISSGIGNSVSGWREIHKKKKSQKRSNCDMHIKQLRHWIRVLQGKERSINPFDSALIQHRQLGNLLADS